MNDIDKPIEPKWIEAYDDYTPTVVLPAHPVFAVCPDGYYVHYPGSSTVIGVRDPNVECWPTKSSDRPRCIGPVLQAARFHGAIQRATKFKFRRKADV